MSGSHHAFHSESVFQFSRVSPLAVTVLTQCATLFATCRMAEQNGTISLLPAGVGPEPIRSGSTSSEIAQSRTALLEPNCCLIVRRPVAALTSALMIGTTALA